MRSGILTSEYVYSSWLSHSHCLLQSQEVDIVGRVDGLCHTVDVVGHRDAPSQLRVVLNVVYTAREGGRRNSTNTTIQVKCSFLEGFINFHCLSVHMQPNEGICL